MSERQREIARLRRCLALRVAIFFGVLLPIIQRDWVTLAIAVVGVGLAAATYWRNCRRSRDEGGT